MAKRIVVWDDSTKELGVSDNVSVSRVLFNSDVLPTDNGTYNLGSSNYMWKDGYFAGAVSANSFYENDVLVSDGYLEADWKVVIDSNTGDVVVMKRGSGEVYRGAVDDSFSYVSNNCSDGDVIEIYGDYTISQSITFTNKSFLKVIIYGIITNNTSNDYAIKFIGANGWSSNRYNEIYIRRIVGNGSNHGILIQDGFNNKVYDTFFDNLDKGITMKSVMEWTESSIIEKCSFRSMNTYSIGFETDTASGGTGSFVNTNVRHINMDVRVYGIYIDSNSKVEQSWFENVHGWVNADNAVFVKVDGSIWRSVFVVPYFEDVNASYTGEIMFEINSGPDCVIIEPHDINISTLYGGTVDKSFISIHGSNIAFANKSPSVYGGITNVHDDFFVGWRLTNGNQKRVLNIFDKDRVNDLLWYWQNTTDWNTIFALKKDGSVDMKGYLKIEGGIVGNNVGSAIAKFMNDANDNKLYMEIFSSDETGSGSEFLITGRYGANLSRVTIKADTLHVNGTISSNDYKFANDWVLTELDDDGKVFKGLRVLNNDKVEILRIAEDGIWFRGNKIV